MAHDEQHAAVLVEVLLEHLMRGVISTPSEMQSARNQRYNQHAIRDTISTQSEIQSARNQRYNQHAIRDTINTPSEIQSARNQRSSTSTVSVAMSRSFVGSSSTRTFGRAARHASSWSRRRSPPLSFATSSCQRLAGKANFVSSCLATFTPTAELPPPPVVTPAET